MRGSGIGYLQGIPAGLDTIKNQKNNRGKTTWANVSRRVYTVGRPKLTTNRKTDGHNISFSYAVVYGFERCTSETQRNQWGGYDSIASLIKDKSKKLLLPFVVVLLLYAVPLKAISGFYAKSTNVFKDILTNEVFIQQGFYLWFLPVLFMIFLIHHIVEKKMHIRKPYKLVFMYVALLLHSVIPINAIRLIAKFIMWFYVGYYFEEYREKANAHISLKTLFIIGSIFVALSYIYSTIHDSAGIDILGAVRLALAPICAVVGCAFVYGISFLLSSTALPATRIFNVLRNNTFGMYLYSDPWNYVVLAVLVHFIGKAVFVADWGSALMYFSRILITGGVSLSFSIFLKKKGIRYIC